MIKNLLAQVPVPIGQPLQGIGPLGSTANAPTTFNKFLSGVIGVMTAIAGIWFTLQFIIGAVGIVTSGGDKASYENARKKITTGLVGLVVIIAAIFLIDLIGTILGVPDILDPAKFINSFRL